VGELRRTPAGLAFISTHWPSITDPMKFVLRYAPAIRGYLAVLLPSAEVEEVLHEFLVSVFEQGFRPERVHRGRFRDYLIAAVRYRAWRHLRRKKPQQLSLAQAEEIAVDTEPPPDAEWVAGWRQCLLDRAWQALEWNERHSPRNRHYTVLKLTVDHPDADSRTLARLVDVDPPLSPAAFRQQLSRARALFARVLIDEVEATLERPTPERVMEELAELGLLAHVRRHFLRRR
jgi:DNA-directed RNA polymerase specialized sigma24 family protein